MLYRTLSRQKKAVVPDYWGGFAVTTGIGCDELVAEFEATMTITTALWPKPLPTVCRSFRRKNA